MKTRRRNNTPNTINNQINTGDIFTDPEYLKAFEEIKIDSLKREGAAKEAKVMEDLVDSLTLKPQNLIQEAVYESNGGELNDANKEYLKKKQRLEEITKKTYGGIFQDIVYTAHESTDNYYEALEYKRQRDIYDKDGYGETLTGKINKKIDDATIGIFKFAEKAAANIAGFIGAGIEKIDNYARGKGMTKEEELEMNLLQKELYEVDKDALHEGAEIQRRELQALKDKYNIKDRSTTGKVMNTISSVLTAGVLDINNYTNLLELDSFAGREAVKAKQAILEEYENAIETGEKGNGFIRTPINTFKGFIQNRMNIKDLGSSIMESYLISKVENKGEESLTEAQKDFLIERNALQEAKNAGLNSNVYYNFGSNFRHSAEFMIDVIPASKIVKSSGLLAKTIVPAVMAGTYTGATENYAEGLMVVDYPNEDGTTTKRLFKSEQQKVDALNSVQRYLAQLESRLEHLAGLEDPSEEDMQETYKLLEEKNASEYVLNQMVDEEGNLKSEDTNYIGSLSRSYVEQGKEFLGETLGGKLDRYIPSIGSSLVRNVRPVRWVAKSKLGTKAENLSKALGRNLKRADDVIFNNRSKTRAALGRVGHLSSELLSHTGPAKIINSLPAEFAEEIFVQIMPTYGEDYVEQLTELTNTDWYTQVGASVLLMGGIMGTGGSAKHTFQLMTDKKYKERYEDSKLRLREQRQFFRDLDNSIKDGTTAKRIAMGVPGTLFHTEDYMTEIAELRNPKGNNPEGLSQEQRDRQADHLEKQAFVNTALQAVESGMERDYRRTLREIIKDKNAGENTKQAATTALNMLEKFSRVIDKNSQIVNGATLTDLETRKLLLEESLKDISNFNNHREYFRLAIEAFNVTQEEAGRRVFDVDEVLDAIESGTNSPNVDFHTYLGRFFENREGQISFQQAAEVMDIHRRIRKEIKDLDRKIEFETNPKNEDYIRLREAVKRQGENKARRERFKQQAIDSTLKDVLEAEEIDNEAATTEEPLQTGDVISHENKEYRVEEDGEIRNEEGETLPDEVVDEVIEEAGIIADKDFFGKPEELSEPASEEDNDYERIVDDTEETNKRNEIEGDTTPQSTIDFGKRNFSATAQDRVFTEDEKNIFRRVYEKLKEELGKDPTFDEFIRSRIKKYGYDHTEKLFSGYESSSRSIGIDTTNSAEVFDKYFSIDDNYVSILEKNKTPAEKKEVQETPEQIEESSRKQEIEVNKKTSERKFKPETGEVEATSKPEDRRTNKPTLRMAFNFQNSIVDKETGIWKVISRYFKKAKETDVLDNKFILDSDFMQKAMQEPDAFKAIKYDNTDQPVGDSTWGVIKERAKKRFGENSQEYKDWYRDNVPIVIVYTGSMAKGQAIPISMVNVVSWYRNETVTETEGKDRQQELIREGQENARSFRNNLLNNNGELLIELETLPENSWGQLQRIDPETDNPLSVNESNPQSVLAIMDASGEFNIGGKKFFDGIVVNKESFGLDTREGSVVYLSQIGTNSQGQPLYLAAKLMVEGPTAPGKLKKFLHETAHNNIKAAVLASTILRNKDNVELLKSIEKIYNMNLAQALEISEAIKNSTKIDIDRDGVSQYIGLFVRTFQKGGFKHVVNDTSRPDMVTYFNSNSDGSVSFIFKGGRTLNKSVVNSQRLIGGKPGKIVNNTLILESLADLLDEENGALPSAEYSLNRDGLGKFGDVELPVFSSDGTIKSMQTLSSIYKDFYKTNIVGHPIETIDGETKYITDVQPMYHFKEKTEQKRTQEEVRQENQNEKPKGKTFEQTMEEIDQQEKEELKSFQDFLDRPASAHSDETLGESIDRKYSRLREKAREEFGQNKKEVILEGTEAKIEAINNSTLDPLQKQIAIGIVLGAAKKNTIYGSATRLKAEDFKSLNTNSIDGLTNEELKEIVEAIKNLIISNLDFTNVNLKYSDIKFEIENSVDKFVSSQIETNNKIIEALEKLEGFQEIIHDIKVSNSKMEKVLDNQQNLIGPEGILIREFNNLFSTDFKENFEEINENEENFSQSFLEKDVKLSYSTFLKMSFFAISKNLKDGTNKNSFGFTEYHKPDIINGKLLDITTKISSNWNVLIESLRNMAEHTKQDVYKEMADKFEALPEHLKNEMLYNTIGSQNTIYKVLNRALNYIPAENKEGETVFIPSSNELTIIDENSSKETFRLAKQIEENFNSSGLVSNINGHIVYNKDKIKELEKILFDATRTRDVSFKAVKDILSKVGADFISDTTIDFLIEQHTSNPQAGILYGNSGLINVLYRQVSFVNNSSESVRLEDFNIVSSARSQLSKVVNAEVLLNKTFLGSSIYVGGKTLQSFIQSTSIYDINKKLTGPDAKSYIETLRNIPATQRNYILEALEQDPVFLEMYKDIGFSSPEAYKVDGKDVPDRADFDKISEQDNLATVMGLYMYSKGAQLDKDFHLGSHPDLKFRKTKMPVHTISDKGRMVYLPSLSLDLREGDISFTDSGITISDPVMSFLRDQIFSSELDRIRQSYTQISGRSNYDLSSKAFILMPSFNSIEIEVEVSDENGETRTEVLNIHDVLNSLAEGKEINEETLQKIQEEADKKIVEYIESETNAKMDSEGNGEFSDLGFYDSRFGDRHAVRNLNTNYLISKPGENNMKKLRFVAAEFAMNNLLHNMTTQALYLGDLSFYSKDSYIPSKTVKNSDGVEILVPDGSKISDPKVYGKMIISIGSNLQKRTALMIAPGKKLANSENPLSKYAQKYIHLALNDTESITSNMVDLIKTQYGEFTEEQQSAWEKIETYKEAIKKIEEQNYTPLSKKRIKRYQNLVKRLANTHFAEISDYFNITGTDAQEYVSWRTHLDLLLRQGKINQEVHDNYIDKIENSELDAEELKLIMQPIKPVHTGMTYDKELNMMIPVYIKSSSFPLLPQMTKNLKIDGIRKAMEALEKQRGIPVHVSYQSANKIGSRDTKLSAEDFYNSDLETLSNNGLLDTGLSILPYSDYRIQQETPSKEQKAFQDGKDSYGIMGSQFFKILFGNFINHDKRKIFDNIFDQSILRSLGIDQYTDKLDGEQLYEIYNAIFFRFSDVLRAQLEMELGLENFNFNDESTDNQNEIIRNLHDLLEKEISSRNYPDYMIDAINLIRDGEREVLESVLMFDSNRHKFESLIQAIISNRLITHKLPGNSHISASSNGIEKKMELDSLSEKERSGIVWINGIPKELEATIITNEKGERVLKKSQVLIKSHWKFRDEDGNFKYVDLSDPKYSEDIIEDNKVVGRKLNLKMIDPALLQMFSYRIPTSSHQSGAVIEVVGFLPNSMQDLLIVPKEHTVQFGEDYDIDKRQTYKYNYFVNPKTNRIQKIHGEIFKDSKIHNLSDNFLEAIFGEEYREIKNYPADKREARIEQKLLENSLIDIYMSIYSSEDISIQQKIFKPLVTDIAEEASTIMDNLMQEERDYSSFNIFSDSYQRYLLKMGADGKDGIGVHSNSVTLEAQLQRLPVDQKVNIASLEIEAGEIKYKNFEDFIGGFKVGQDLGVSAKTLDGGRDISDQHGENQNVSTDNISKQIMGKRNENSYTMSIYAFMAHLGIDKSADSVYTGQKDSEGKPIQKPIHVPSFFINQPILRDYVRLRQQFDSMSSEYVPNRELEIVNILSEKYGFKFDLDTFEEDGTILPEDVYVKLSKNMSGTKLFGNIKEEAAMKDPYFQAAVLDKFFKYQRASKDLFEMQQLLNLHSTRLGVSYFEVIQRIEKLNDFAEKQELAEETGHKGNNYTKLIGDFKSEPEEGYIKVGNYYWKPTTVEGKMFIDAITTANKILPAFFPYDSPFISSTIENIFKVRGLDPNAKSASNLKLKYEIMTEFVNYINSGSNSVMKDPRSRRRSLFFQTEDNMALGNIILDLKKKQHPIMSNSLLSSLDIETNVFSEVVRIVHGTNDQTTLDKSTKYEDFKNLLQDDTILGEYNGAEYKVSDLAQDLISYAMLSDDYNGAIGFKTYIPTEFFSIVGDNQRNRDLFRDIVDNSNPEYLDSLKEAFIQQYFQHNPKRAAMISNSKYEKEGIGVEEGTRPKSYVTVVRNNVAIRLFKYEPTIDSYIDIPILGQPGVFKEYDSTRSSSIFRVPHNNDKRGRKRLNKYNSKFNKAEVSENMKEFDEEYKKITSVGRLVEIYADSENINPKTKKIFEEIFPFIDPNTKLVFDNMSRTGMYESISNTIHLNTKLWQTVYDQNNGDLEATKESVANIVLEEVLHSITINNLHKYIISDPTTGIVTYKDEDNAPLYIKNLVKIYEIAREKVPYNPHNLKGTYGSQNIEEFIANVFSNPDYRRNLESEHKGFIQEFLKTVRGMLRYLYSEQTGVYPKYDDVIFNNVLEMLEENNQDITLVETKDPVEIDPIQKIKNDSRTENIERPLETVNSYKGVPIVESNNIESEKNQSRAVQYDGESGEIKVNTPLLQEKYKEKAWTKMEEPVETTQPETIQTIEIKRMGKILSYEVNTNTGDIKNIQSGKIISGKSPLGRQVLSKVEWDRSEIENETSTPKNLSPNQFKTFEEFRNFSIEQEYQRSIYSRQDFDAEFPNRTQADYEDEINQRSLNALNLNTTDRNQENENVDVDPLQERINKINERRDEALNNLNFSEFTSNTKNLSKKERDVLKSNLKNKIDSLPDDVVYHVHQTGEDGAANVFRNGFKLQGPAVESTFLVMSKDTMFEVLSDLIDGKTKHRGATGAFIYGVPKEFYGDQKQIAGNTFDALVENGFDLANMNLPTEFNVGFFNNGKLQTETETQIIERYEEEIESIQEQPAPVIIPEASSFNGPASLSQVMEKSSHFSLDVENGVYVDNRTGEKYQRQSNYVEEILDKKTDQNSENLKASLLGGDFIDAIGRDIFGGVNLKTAEEYKAEAEEKNRHGYKMNMSLHFFDDIVNILKDYRDNGFPEGTKFHTNDITISKKFLKPKDGLVGVAGVVDILAETPDGKFHIIDMKSRKITKNNIKFMNNNIFQGGKFESSVSLWSDQQTVYKELIDLPIESINIMLIPYVYDFSGNEVSAKYGIPPSELNLNFPIENVSENGFKGIIQLSDSNRVLDRLYQDIDNSNIISDKDINDVNLPCN